MAVAHALFWDELLRWSGVAFYEDYRQIVDVSAGMKTCTQIFQIVREECRLLAMKCVGKIFQKYWPKRWIDSGGQRTAYPERMRSSRMLSTRMPSAVHAR